MPRSVLTIVAPSRPGPNDSGRPRIAVGVAALTLAAATGLTGGFARAATIASSAAATTPTYQGQVFNPGGVGPFYPAGAVADAAGTVWAADSGGNRIDMVTSAGITVLSTPGLSNPRNISLDVTDPTKLWVTDTGNNRLVEVSTAGPVLNTFAAGALKSPFGNDNDATGVYIADTYHQQIVKVAKTDGHTIWSQASCHGALSRPRDVAVGSDGKVYAVDTDNSRVVVLDPSTGTCFAAFGRSGAAPGQFKAPRALASDRNGGLWVAEDGNFRLQHVTNAGTSLAIVGSNSVFNAPSCVYMSGATVNVCDTFKWAILSFIAATGASNGTVPATPIPPALGGFNNPFGVCFDATGNMYVTDMFNQRIEKFDPSGTAIKTWGTFGGGKGSMQNPRGISWDPVSGDVVLTNSENNRIDLFTTNGVFVKSIKTGNTLGWPHQSVAMADGSVWTVDTNNNRVLHLSSTGAQLAVWTAGFTTPRGIAFDGTHLYIANSGNNTVQEFDPKGTGSPLATVAGAGTSIGLSLPWNITVSGGKLYIADGNDDQVVVVNLAADTLDSRFGSTGTGPGQFSSPRSVAVNPLTGIIAVADFNNNRISLWK